MAKASLKKKLNDELKTVVLKDIPKTLNSNVANQLGYGITESIRGQTAKGINPTDEGGRRYAAYKHAGKKGKYPDSAKKKFPSKRDRPVNLRLSGEFMSALNFYYQIGKEGMQIFIGYFDSKNVLKEKGHRKMAGGQPSRPTLPSEGKDFNKTIRDMISLVSRKHIFNTLRRNKKFK